MVISSLSHSIYFHAGLPSIQNMREMKCAMRMESLPFCQSSTAAYGITGTSCMEYGASDRPALCHFSICILWGKMFLYYLSVCCIILQMFWVNIFNRRLKLEPFISKQLIACSCWYLLYLVKIYTLSFWWCCWAVKQPTNSNKTFACCWGITQPTNSNNVIACCWGICRQRCNSMLPGCCTNNNTFACCCDVKQLTNNYTFACCWGVKQPTNNNTFACYRGIKQPTNNNTLACCWGV